MILTGRVIDADEAERIGLVARVVPQERLLDEAMETAAATSTMPAPVTMMAKEVVNAAYSITLDAGIRFERRRFHSICSSTDQKEGMRAFMEKRRPTFGHG